MEINPIPKISISVRNLVEYVFRSGSIDSRFRPSSSLIEGTKIHQKIQKTYRDIDRKEVSLQTEIVYNNILFSIEGRCDGLLAVDNGGKMIDEIKSVSGDIHSISSDSYPVHWAQAKCYAYIYAKENRLKQIHVQLTYVKTQSVEQRKFQKSYQLEQLELFIQEMIRMFYPFANVKRKHSLKRDESIRKLEFPFQSFRPGQRKLAAFVYGSIKAGSDLFANAPTGIGKTISTVFPAIKAFGEGKINRLFYLTAKTITKQTAEEAFSLLSKNSLIIKAVSITAKEKVCLNGQIDCRKEACPFADGYYDRINGAAIDIFSKENLITREVIDLYARKHVVCPFEFSLDLAYIADAIICDYNYVFDPSVSLKRFFDEQKKKSVLLIDEAHNLLDRSREMFSADLSKSMFLSLKKIYKGRNKPIYESGKMINQYFIDLKKVAGEQKEIILDDPPQTLISLIEQFIERTEQLFLSGESGKELTDAYFASVAFIKTASYYDDRFTCYSEKDRNEVKIKLFCIDPSGLLKKMGGSYFSKIYFSATLQPFDYFKDMLGATQSANQLAVSSPFSKDQTDVFILPLSTRFTDREKSLFPISRLLENLFSERPGNYLVFFPSYQYMNDFYNNFLKEKDDIDTIVQSVTMTEQERRDFLDSFQPDRKKPLVGFAVLGGAFSEGVDLKGNRLNGVVIVGVGLPQIGFERKMISEYFSRIEKNGYDYSYVFPGMNKVLQAGGRLIRSEHDTGTIVLVDDRFLQSKYLKLLPDEWKSFRII
ncbi:MAG: ATP-dependent DNA helicase [Bacillota bacterium]|nr:ATP-dependent DNA helicase [Bacillota bacterium]